MATPTNTYNATEMMQAIEAEVRSLLEKGTQTGISEYITAALNMRHYYEAREAINRYWAEHANTELKPFFDGLKPLREIAEFWGSEYRRAYHKAIEIERKRLFSSHI